MKPDGEEQTNMKPDGRAESALEQLLWAYTLGKASVSDGPTPPLDMQELSRMYQVTCGIQPRREELAKWVKQVDAIVRVAKGVKA